MSEPTKEQGDEAEYLACRFDKKYSWQFVLRPSALFKLIAQVRAQENNDTLERAAVSFENKAYDYASDHGYYDPATGALEFGRGTYGEIKNDYYSDLHENASAIRAMKVPT